MSVSISLTKCSIKEGNGDDYFFELRVNQKKEKRKLFEGGKLTQETICFSGLDNSLKNTNVSVLFYLKDNEVKSETLFFEEDVPETRMISVINNFSFGRFQFVLNFQTGLDALMLKISNIFDEEKYLNFAKFSPETTQIKREILGLVLLYQTRNNVIAKKRLDEVSSLIRNYCKQLEKELLKDGETEENKEKAIIKECAISLHQDLVEITRTLKKMKMKSKKKVSRSFRRKKFNFNNIPTLKGTLPSKESLNRNFSREKERNKRTLTFVKQFDPSFMGNDVSVLFDKKEAKKKLVQQYSRRHVRTQTVSETIYSSLKNENRNEVMKILERIDNSYGPNDVKKSLEKILESNIDVNQINDVLKHEEAYIKRVDNYCLMENTEGEDGEDLSGMYFHKSTVLIYYKIIDKLVKMLYFRKNPSFVEDLIFDKKGHEKFKALEDKIVNKFSKLLSIDDFEIRMIHVFVILENYKKPDKFIFRHLKIKLKTISKQYCSSTCNRGLLTEVKLLLFKHLEDLFRHLDIYLVGEKISLIRSVLKMIVHFEDIVKKVYLNDYDIRKDVIKWIKGTSEESFKRYYNKRKNQIGIGTKLEGNVLEAASLISSMDEIMDEIEFYKSTFSKYFKTELKMNFHSKIARFFLSVLFNETVDFCAKLSNEQIGFLTGKDGAIIEMDIEEQEEKIRKEEQLLEDSFLKRGEKPLDVTKATFCTSLEMFRQFCPKFVSTWSHLYKYLVDEDKKDLQSFNYYSLFYQLVKNTITENTKKLMRKWVSKAYKLEDYVKFSNDDLYSLSCKNVLEILFSPIEAVYEIDIVIQKDAEGIVREEEQPFMKERPKSLVFTYFEVIQPLYFDYMMSLKKRIFQIEKTDKKKFLLMNNIQGSLLQMLRTLSNQDTKEIFFELSTGGEFGYTNKTQLKEIPVFKKILKNINQVRNQVCFEYSKLVYKELKPIFDNYFRFHIKKKSLVVLRDEKEKIFEKLIDQLDKVAMNLMNNLYFGIVEKIFEYLLALFIDDCLHLILEIDNFFEIKEFVYEFVKAITDFFYCEGDGVKLMVLNHYSQRLFSLMNLYQKINVDYLINLYESIKNNNVVNKTVEYFVTLNNVDDDDEYELDPNHVLLIIEKLGKILDNKNAIRYIKNIKEEAKKKGRESRSDSQKFKINEVFKGIGSSLKKLSFKKKKKKKMEK